DQGFVVANGSGGVRAADRLCQRGEFAAGTGHRSQERSGGPRFFGSDSVAAVLAISVREPRSSVDWRSVRGWTCSDAAEGNRGSSAAIFRSDRGGHPLGLTSAAFQSDGDDSGGSAVRLRASVANFPAESQR